MTSPLDRQQDAEFEAVDGGFTDDELDSFASVLDGFDIPEEGDAEAGEAPTESVAEDATTAKRTGGMVALLPDEATARKLALPAGEPVAELHLTLAYLGEDVTWLLDEPDVAEEIPAAVRSAIGDTPGFPGIVRARAFAHITFNGDGGPDGDREPCAVYGIGDSTIIGPLRTAVVERLGEVEGLVLPMQHEPFVPHVTAGYGYTAADLSYLGPAVFDRVVVTMAGRRVEIPLLAAEPADSVGEAAPSGQVWAGWDRDEELADVYADRITAAVTAALGDPQRLAQAWIDNTHP